MIKCNKCTSNPKGKKCRYESYDFNGICENFKALSQYRVFLFNPSSPTEAEVFLDNKYSEGYHFISCSHNYYYFKRS